MPNYKAASHKAAAHAAAKAPLSGAPKRKADRRSALAKEEDADEFMYDKVRSPGMVVLLVGVGGWVDGWVGE